MVQTAVSFDRVGQAATIQPIPLAFEEGQEVTLLPGARVGLGDLVQWGYALCAEPREGTVKRLYKGIFLVEFEFGAQRWCFADEIKLILKAAAREKQTAEAVADSAVA